ncbi:MAG: dephospho-CoA kinase [Lachnospiraceae bacterium]|nr:dephospho-CoA kinase [Lachnospiraceae bacterium]
MKILGITGGVGSGKSRVLYELENKYKAFVVEADKLAHELMLPGEKIYNQIIDEFGKEVLCADYPYSIDRIKLGNIVFNDKDKLEKLNSISHPLVKERILELIKEHSLANNTKLFVIEAALLIEAGYRDICDQIWYIWVDKEERIKRLIESRGYTREKCLSIFSSQQKDDFYKKYANYTINNQNGFEDTSKQLKDLLNILLNNDIIS